MLSHVRLVAAWSAGKTATTTVNKPVLKNKDLDLMSGEAGARNDRERALANGLRGAFMESGRRVGREPF